MCTTRVVKYSSLAEGVLQRIRETFSRLCIYVYKSTRIGMSHCLSCIQPWRKLTEQVVIAFRDVKFRASRKFTTGSLFRIVDLMRNADALAYYLSYLEILQCKCCLLIRVNNFDTLVKRLSGKSLKIVLRILQLLWIFLWIYRTFYIFLN